MNPDVIINYEALCTVLYRMAGKPELNENIKVEAQQETVFGPPADPSDYTVRVQFADKINGYYDSLYGFMQDWAVDGLVWATANGVLPTTNGYRIVLTGENALPEDYQAKNSLSISGYSATGQRNCSRLEIATTLYFFCEYMGYELPEAADTSVFTDYEDFRWELLPEYQNFTDYEGTANKIVVDIIGWAVSCGILQGYPDGTMRLTEDVTRAEFAAMICRFMDYYMN